MNASRARWIGILCLLLPLAALAKAPRGEDFEQPHEIPLAEALPEAARSGRGWVVADPAFADGFGEHFELRTDKFGEFVVASELLLGIRVRELHALDQLAEVRKGEAYTKALAKAGAAPAYLVKDLLTRPVETVTGVPKGIWKAERKAVTWLAGDRRKRAETENSATRDVIGFSRRKRELAGELGVDPYTSNLVLQDELDRVAWAGFAGGLSFTVALAAAGIPPAALAVYRTTRVAQDLNVLVASMSGSDLHQRNREALFEMGIDPEKVNAFLDNPHVSPTHQTAITLALEGMPGVEGRGVVVELGIEVEHEDATLRLERSAELARGYHANVEPLAALVRSGRDILLRTRSETGVAALPADRLLWTAESRDLTERLRAIGAAEAGGAGRIFLVGVFSERARTELEARGFALHPESRARLEADEPPPVP